MLTNLHSSDAAAEQHRLHVLRDYGVLDTPPDPVFDDLTAMAAKLCNTPISFISLIDENRQWFKSRHGFSLQETPLALSFCVHAIRLDLPLVVIPDLRADTRFADNPIVKGEPHVRFYAAAPLRSPEGCALGTLCVIDLRPRELTADQAETMLVLARQAMSQLELRRALAKIQSVEERFHSAARAMSDVIWEWDLRSRHTDGMAPPLSRTGSGNGDGSKTSARAAEPPASEAKAASSADAAFAKLAANTRWWSEGFERVFGYPAAETPTTAEGWMANLHADDRERVLKGLTRAINSLAASWQDEYRLRRHDGSFATVRDRAEILRDAQGRAYRVCGGMRDLTERRQVEAEALRAQRLDSLGSLAGGIAHDLNNVITPVLMASEMLKQELAERHSEALLVETISAGAKRAAELVQQVVSFARGAKGPYARTSVAAVLHDVVLQARGTFPSSITIEETVPEDLWRVSGNTTHLHQAFMALLANARDAMPNGGTLSIVAANTLLPIETCSPFKRKNGAYVVVSVRDTGTGMSPEVQDRCFEPFFTTKPPGSGAGLGLTTVHGIITSHQGFVRLTSAVGKGTTFQVCLPAEQEPGTPAFTSLPARKAKRGRGELVLLVDDEEAIRLVAGRLLEADGYRVAIANNGKEALELFRARPEEFNLVVMDLMMPVMDGITCIGEMTKIRKDVRIVVASGGLHPASASHRTLPQGLPFLPKPYLGEALLTMVRQTLDAR